MLHPTARCPQRLGHIVHLHSLIIAQQHGLAQTRRQRRYGLNNRIVRWLRAVGAFRQLGQIGIAVMMPHPGGAQHIPAGIDGDFHQPGLLAAIAAKAVQPGISLQKGFLHRILRQGIITQVQAAHAQQRRAVLRHQALQRSLPVPRFIRLHAVRLLSHV